MKKIILNLLFTLSTLSATDGGWYIGANKDINNDSTRYQVGYLREDNSGRLELYHKQESVDLFDTTTMGFRGENTFFPFGESYTILPFFSGGFGVGNLSGVDNTVVFEYEFGIGIHYFIYKKLDILGGFFWRKVDINIENDDTYNMSTSTSNIEIGINYHF